MCIEIILFFFYLNERITVKDKGLIDQFQILVFIRMEKNLLFVNLIVSMMIVCNTFLNCYIFLSRLFLVIIIIFFL